MQAQKPLKVFIGYDPRQPVAYNVLQHSIISHSSVPVSITPLVLSQLPIKSAGLTQFTYSRFLVPWLCSYEGMAVFMDADMVVTGDVAELFQLPDPTANVSVVKDQPTFEWPSLMMFNCELCKGLTPEFVDNPDNGLLKLGWAEKVGDLPKIWNHTVMYDDPVDSEFARLFHYTCGIPAFIETNDSPEAHHWKTEMRRANHTVPWSELMGRSVHAKRVLAQYLRRYGIEMKVHVVDAPPKLILPT